MLTYLGRGGGLEAGDQKAAPARATAGGQDFASCSELQFRRRRVLFVDKLRGAPLAPPYVNVGGRRATIRDHKLSPFDLRKAYSRNIVQAR